MRHPKSLLAMLAVAAIAAGASAQEPKKAGVGLVGWWKFDDGHGDAAKDSSGNGHDGKVIAGQWVRGRFGAALRFDGERSLVIIPHLAEVDGSDALTVEAWVFWEGMGRYPNILTGGAWNPGGFLVFVSDGSCSFRMGKPGKKPWTLRKDWQEAGATLVKFDLGKWYHLAATFKRPTITTYVNGKSVGSASWNFPVGQTGDLQVGKWGLDQGKTQSHCGLIDELKIYRRALSADDIQASYDREAAKRK